MFVTWIKTRTFEHVFVKKSQKDHKIVAEIVSWSAYADNTEIGASECQLKVVGGQSTRTWSRGPVKLAPLGHSWWSVRVSLTPTVTICDPTVTIFGRDFARMNELRVISGYRHGNRYSVLQVYNNRILYIRPAHGLRTFFSMGNLEQI